MSMINVLVNDVLVVIMRILVQRVLRGCVRVEGVQVGCIGSGLLVLVGLTHSDTMEVVEHMINKTLGLRLWGKDKAWSESVKDVEGEILVVSQFTLYAVLKGNKPDYHQAMNAEKAKILYHSYIDGLRARYIPNRIQHGQFQALMEVQSVNHGPVTIEYQKNASPTKDQLISKEQFMQ